MRLASSSGILRRAFTAALRNLNPYTKALPSLNKQSIAESPEVALSGAQPVVFMLAEIRRMCSKMSLNMEKWPKP